MWPWCRSPDRWPQARRSPRRRRRRSSGSTSSSAARRRSSCSTTPTPAAVAAGVRAAGYYNSGQDCTAACRVIAGPKVHDDLVAALQAEVSQIPFGDPTDADTEVGPVVSAEQRAGERHGRQGQGRRRRGAHQCLRPRGRRLLLRPVHRGGAGPGQRDRAARGVRPGRHRAAGPRRGDAPRLGQRRRLRPGRLACGPPTSAGPCAWPPACGSARYGSTTTSRS